MTQKVNPDTGQVFDDSGGTWKEISPPEKTLSFLRKNHPAVYRKAINRTAAFPAGDPTASMTGLERFTAGGGKAFADILRGGEQVARQMVPGVSPREQQLQAEIDESRRLDAPLMSTGAGMAGNIAGNAAALLPAAGVGSTALGAATLGGALGATQPVATGESRAMNAGLGALGGGVGQTAINAAGRVLGPQTSQAVRSMREMDVPLTIGQTLGGAAKRIEDATMSVPVIGDAIRTARNRSFEGFNKAVLNRVVRPLGAKIDDVGYEGVEKAHRIVRKAYHDILPKVDFKADKKLMDDVAALGIVARDLPEDRQGQFMRFVQDHLARRFGGDKIGKMSGKTFKEIDSKFGTEGRRYLSSTDGDQRKLGELLLGVQKAMRGALQRGNPRHRAALRKADRAYAELLRVETAAGKTGAHGGVFSASQLLQSARQLDQSLRKRASAHGRTPFQKLAEEAHEVLPSKVADSGTPLRGLVNAAALGGGAYLDPTITAGLLAGGGLYRPGMQSLLGNLATARPAPVAALGRGVSAVSPGGGILGAAYVPGSGLLAEKQARARQ